MKLSVSAFRAQASAQRKILSSYQNQLNYGACTSFPALGGFKSPLSPEVEILDLEFFASRRVLKAAAIPATSLNIDPDSLKS
ncbi:hypothetical protein RUM44_013871 [Polyplax serrata]|uniref:Uncharacterized protein n=1 Tax=Polyplax serrata TaxID=468196 RepID=A0ABR1BFD3_POLSC